MSTTTLTKTACTAEYQGHKSYTHGIRGDTILYEVNIGDRMYKITTDSEGKPIKALRYNEKYNMDVEVSFADSDQSAFQADVRETLKGLYIKKVLDVRGQ